MSESVTSAVFGLMFSFSANISANEVVPGGAVTGRSADSPKGFVEVKDTNLESDSRRLEFKLASSEKKHKEDRPVTHIKYRKQK